MPAARPPLATLKPFNSNKMICRSNKNWIVSARTLTGARILFAKLRWLLDLTITLFPRSAERGSIEALQPSTFRRLPVGFPRSAELRVVLCECRACLMRTPDNLGANPARGGDYGGQTDGPRPDRERADQRNKEGGQRPDGRYRRADARNDRRPRINPRNLEKLRPERRRRGLRRASFCVAWLKSRLEVET